MSIKSKLLKIKDKINTVEIMGEEIHYKHLKGAQTAIIASSEQSDVDALIFALCACEADGSLMFSLDEIDQFKELPTRIINAVSKAALMGDEKKPQEA